jgi:hypothetical protein
MLGDVRKDLHLQSARDDGGEFIAQADKFRTHMGVDLLHPFIETFNSEDLEIYRGEAQCCHCQSLK